MSDNPQIDNPRNGDYKVRSTDLGPTLGVLQHARIDIGVGTAESLVSPANPLPVTSAPSSSSTTPLSSSTGSALAASGPMGMMYFTQTTVSASNASNQTIEVFGGTMPTGGTEVRRGDFAAFMTSGAGTQYSSTSTVGEIESVTATNFTLKNPLPYTPTSSQKIYFLRRAYLPLQASSRNTGVPIVPVDISNNTVLDGQDPSGVNVAGQGLPIEGWDLSAGGVNRQLRMRSAAPASNDVGVVVRDVESPAQTTALQIIDDWDESDRAKVNLIVGQAGVQGNTGVVTASTQRVVLATDVTPPLPSGAATAALQTTGNTSLGSIDISLNSVRGTTDDAFDKFLVVGGRYVASKTTIADGNIGELCLTEYRAAKVCLFDSAGKELTAVPVTLTSMLSLVAGTAKIGKVGHDIDGPTSFSGTVTTAGTAVRYSVSSIPCKRVSIMNPADSTAILSVGGSATTATAGSQVGWQLNPGDGRSFDCSDVNQIYINADTSSARYIGDYS